MIPKIIHYCWFGQKPKSKEAEAYIENWHKVCPDYQFIEWNESNFDVEASCQYVKEAYAAGKWAFVTDYVRLYALAQYGGIYLDTDVEVLKDYKPLLDNNAFLCAESKYSVCTATIGAKKDSAFIKDLLEIYKDRKFKLDQGYDTTPNSQLIFNWLRDNCGYVYSDTDVQFLNNCTVYPSDYFSPINCYTLACNVTEDTYSIHRYEGTWKSPKEKAKDKIMANITKIIGEEKRQKIKDVIKGRKKG